ncbi:hypothetical protein BJX70DRAFT_282775 [Aspergillus crustosus]
MVRVPIGYVTVLAYALWLHGLLCFLPGELAVYGLYRSLYSDVLSRKRIMSRDPMYSAPTFPVECCEVKQAENKTRMPSHSSRLRSWISFLSSTVQDSSPSRPRKRSKPAVYEPLIRQSDLSPETPCPPLAGSCARSWSWPSLRDFRSLPSAIFPAAETLFFLVPLLSSLVLLLSCLDCSCPLVVLQFPASYSSLHSELCFHCLLLLYLYVFIDSADFRRGMPTSAPS